MCEKSIISTYYFKSNFCAKDYDYSDYDKEEGVSEDILVMPDSYLQKTKNMEFGVGHTMVSHTNEVRLKRSLTPGK